MTPELVRGENRPLHHSSLGIRVTAAVPLLVCATLTDAAHRLPGTAWLAAPGSPVAPGVVVPEGAAAVQDVGVDLGAVPDAAHAVQIALVLPGGAGGPDRFGATVAPLAEITATDGTPVVRFTLGGLDGERAVVAFEFYRRHSAWKVRAVGQGWVGGLADLLGDRGLPDARTVAAAVGEAAVRIAGERRTHEAHPSGARGGTGTAQQRDVPGPRDAAHDLPAQAGPPPHRRSAGQGQGQRQGQAPARPPAVGGGARIDYTHPRRGARPAPAGAGEDRARADGHDSGPPRPVAGDATGWSMDERLYNQVWGMFEDLARSASAFRGASEFATSRMDRELDRVLSDPRTRVGAAADAARLAARSRRDALVEQARTALDRDLAQLAAESEVVEAALPAAYARWDAPAWQTHRVPAEAPMAVRLGDLRLPESAGLRIPLLLRLPLERGVWIDCGRVPGGAASAGDPAGLRRRALGTAVLHAARLLAVHPAHTFGVEVIDPAGSGTVALAPLVRAGVLAAPPAAGPAGVSEALAALVRRVDLVRMAVRAGSPESLPPDLDTAERLLIVHDFPHGFDDRAVTLLRYLADEGPSAGVHLLVVADREDADAYGPVLDPLWRSLLRLTPVADDHLADPWVGHAWTYEPPVVPAGSAVLARVLAEVAASRQR